jgi:hypothetical protein
VSDRLTETNIVRALANAAAKRIARRVISGLCRMKYTLSADDSGLKTTWDEICAQVQYEESLDWDTYDYTVRSLVEGYVVELPHYEREALWLQTDPGEEWDIERSEERDPYPVIDDDIIDFLVHKYVYTEAGRWSNARIRAFIERSAMRD